MIKFCELYEMNARWRPSKTLTMCVGLEFKELLTAKRAYEKYGNYLVINFENDWVNLKEEEVKND